MSPGPKAFCPLSSTDTKQSIPLVKAHKKRKPLVVAVGLNLVSMLKSTMGCFKIVIRELTSGNLSITFINQSIYFVKWDRQRGDCSHKWFFRLGGEAWLIIIWLDPVWSLVILGQKIRVAVKPQLSHTLWYSLRVMSRGFLAHLFTNGFWCFTSQIWLNGKPPSRARVLQYYCCLPVRLGSHNLPVHDNDIEFERQLVPLWDHLEHPSFSLCWIYLSLCMLATVVTT